MSDENPEHGLQTKLLYLIVKMLYRLFWLITQAPNVARYASDVVMFSHAYIATGIEAEEEKIVRRTMQGYIDVETDRKNK